MALDELKGVIVPIITPVDDQDRVDEPAFRKAIQFVIDTGVNGIFCGGSAGEGPLLATREWLRMVEIAYDECRGRVHLLGGAIDTSAARVVDKIGILADVGYSKIVVTPVFYTATKTRDEHLRLFGAAKEACGHRDMIAYNIPSCTDSEIAVETMCEMASRGWISYCKESSGNVDYFRRLITAGKDVGLRCFMGDEAGIRKGLLAGACGIVPVCANYEPQTFVRAYKAAAEGNTGELDRLYERIMLIRARVCLSGDCWLAGVKYAASTLGIGSGKPVSPLQPTGPKQQKMIRELSTVVREPLKGTGTRDVLRLRMETTN
jgi:4-hydroxy-tetrahydrodipicolinate synthase